MLPGYTGPNSNTLNDPAIPLERLSLPLPSGYRDVRRHQPRSTCALMYLASINSAPEAA